MARTSTRILALAAVAATALNATWTTATPAQAESLSVIASRDSFVQTVTGREMRRFGIRLTVSPEGQISGRAFGYPVTGAWQWSEGYFCRDLFWGGDDLGYNCQLVQIDGARVRFTSDQGTGEFADLTLQ